MTDFLERFVCSPTKKDRKLFVKGVQMDIELLNLPFLLERMHKPLYHTWYLDNLCLRIGSMTGGVLSMTGGVLSAEDDSLIQFGVKLYGLTKGKGLPRMFFSQHECSDECYYCINYRNNLLMQFGFESIKSLIQKGAALSIGDDGDDGADGADEDNEDNGDGYEDNGDGYEDTDLDDIGDDAGYDGYEDTDLDDIGEDVGYEDYNGYEDGDDGDDGDDEDVGYVANAYYNRW
jgi:hypothetical protein